MSRLRLVVALIFSFFLLTSAKSPDDSVVKRVISQSAKLEILKEDGEVFARGTAFHYKGPIYITAGHCAGKMSKLYDGFRLNGKPATVLAWGGNTAGEVKVSDTTDWAILYCDLQIPDAMRYRNFAFEPGSYIFHVGNDNSIGMTARFGCLAEMSTEDGLWYASYPGGPGGSGGPVCLANGDVIGIQVIGYTSGDNGAFVPLYPNGDILKQAEASLAKLASSNKIEGPSL